MGPSPDKGTKLWYCMEIVGDELERLFLHHGSKIEFEFQWYLIEIRLASTDMQTVAIGRSKSWGRVLLIQ